MTRMKQPHLTVVIVIIIIIVVELTLLICVFTLWVDF